MSKNIKNLNSVNESFVTYKEGLSPFSAQENIQKNGLNSVEKKALELSIKRHKKALDLLSE
ncbi:hypothetical protein L1994_11460 [Methanomicrobium antiquum]|uniref:Uncharacterized protein n=1 Tax=Methanomicrobium antiquum TaxID=487686 RepID=A0AAF0FQC5_9EURY|nr:hypothetical protein [Methanomicrobium antiquum]WFN36734.1 hypothetical protein L1994_11460 [Methanomicrobium antiquum]